MPLIEGIGDEVTQFFVVVLCGLVALLAWWSTGYRHDRFRTVVIMERNVRRLYTLMPRRINGRARHQNASLVRENTSETSPQTESDEASDDEGGESYLPELETASGPPTELIAELNDVLESSPVNPDTITSPQDEMNSIVNAMDSDTSILRNRRLAFFTDSTPTNSNVTQTTSESEKTSEHMAKDEPQSEATQEDIKENSTEEAAKESTTANDNIRIRLKYLNDELKMVEGSLHEPLGDFKRRHFRGELRACKLVRLIFNGQVLQREAATLASCGLFDNCVVHCLVHQPRTPHQYAQVQQQLNPTTTGDATSSTTGDSPNEAAPQMEGASPEERDWDLSNILLTLLASILSIAWYCHIRFASLFGVATSLAMLGLTGLYFIAVICVYFPDTQPAHIHHVNTTDNNREANTID